MTTGAPVFISYENLGLFLIGVLITVILLGGWLLGWRAGLRDKRRRHQELEQAKRPPQTAIRAEAERLLRLRLERGEIDQATYERELESIRQRAA